MKKWLGLLVLLVIVLAAAWIASQLGRPYQGYKASVILVIRPGANASDAARVLQSHGVLRYRYPFLVRYVIGRLAHRTIKSGEYQFTGQNTPADVYEKLARGEVYLHTVLIPEGSDRLEMASIYSREIGLDPAEFLRVTSNPAPIRDLDPLAPSLEGYLFPDTYRFPRGASATTVVDAMLRQFREVWSHDFQGQLPPGPDSLHRVMTLASLVEKETPEPSERPLIAGVFARRLKIGMALQCDPTVIYAMRLRERAGDPDGTLFTGPPTHADLATPSPYNTYLHAGLPPGPICSPGAASISAALHPAAGTALYFVSNNHGGHIFASTLEEQNRNVARYRKERRAEQSAKNGGH